MSTKAETQEKVDATDEVLTEMIRKFNIMNTNNTKTKTDNEIESKIPDKDLSKLSDKELLARFQGYRKAHAELTNLMSDTDLQLKCLDVEIMKRREEEKKRG